MTATVRCLGARVIAWALCLAFAAGAAHAAAEPPAGAASAAGSDAATVPKPEEAGMWIGTAAVVCLEQDAALKATPFGQQLVNSPAYGAWHAGQKPVILACLAKKRMLPAAVCKDIFAQDPENHDDHSRVLYDKNAAGLANLSRLDECTSL